MSGCAFSISSNNTTEYGLRLTASVIVHLRHNPHTLEVHQLIGLQHDVLDIRSCQYASWHFHRQTEYSAKAFANSVLPTPVVPKNKNVPIGFCGFCRPALERLTASLTATIASSCPTTRLCNSSSSLVTFHVQLESFWLQEFLSILPPHPQYLHKSLLLLLRQFLVVRLVAFEIFLVLLLLL